MEGPQKGENYTGNYDHQVNLVIECIEFSVAHVKPVKYTIADKC